MLATTSLGAIWSSCSPDFGERGVLDRFGQIEPKVFIAVDGYWYNGKALSLADKLKGIVPQLPTAKTVVIVPYLDEAETTAKALPNAVTLDAFLKPHQREAADVRADAVQSPGFTFSIRPAPPACRNASCMAPAAHCCSM